MKATSLLQKQHRKVEGLFKKLEAVLTDSVPLITELANDLCAHMKIEQELFYPAVREVDQDLVMESYEEHAMAELALKRLLATKSEDADFKAKVVTLKELIKHHVQEEEDELHPGRRKEARERRARGTRQTNEGNVR